MKRVSMVSIVCALMLSTAFVYAADKKKDTAKKDTAKKDTAKKDTATKAKKKKALDLSKAKCPVTGKAVKKQHVLGRKGSQVFFCCPGCPKAYVKNPKKYSTKANHQLVVTKQSVTSKCALTGKPCSPKHTASVDGVKVYFCCPGCKGKVEKAEGDAKLALVFANVPFKRGFKLATKRKKGRLNIKPRKDKR